MDCFPRAGSGRQPHRAADISRTLERAEAITPILQKNREQLQTNYPRQKGALGRFFQTRDGPQVADIAVMRGDGTDFKMLTNGSGIMAFRAGPRMDSVLFIAMRRIALGAVLVVAMSPPALSQTTDKEKRNRNVIRHYHESVDRGDMKEALSDISEDMKNFGRHVGREGVQRVLEDT